MILTDGVIGQMMEKVELSPFKPRWTDAQIEELNGSWAATGKKAHRERYIKTSLEMVSEKQEKINQNFQDKYKQMENEDVRYEAIQCDDAEYIIVAYGVSARISQKAVDILRAEGVKVGLLRPITLFPFPKKIINELADRVKGFLSVEMSSGQMVEDVRLSVNGKKKVEHFGRMGGVIATPSEVVDAIHSKLIGG
jgi:2-oxoglutarate ferredoxin oxidoreductase subunit alpha